MPPFHWLATLGKLFTHIASAVSQLQETRVQKWSFRCLSGYGYEVCEIKLIRARYNIYNLTLLYFYFTTTPAHSWQYLLVALQLLQPDDGRTSKLCVVAMDQQPIEQVLHDAWNWLELSRVTLCAIDGARVMTVKPMQDACVTERMFTLWHLQQPNKYTKNHPPAAQTVQH